ncbi:Putative uncharacterized protein [Halomonas sp. R57-5]|nr:Putative uncharacterized protein [Halomonas sp. R57-5]
MLVLESVVAALEETDVVVTCWAFDGSLRKGCASKGALPVGKEMVMAISR